MATTRYLEALQATETKIWEGLWLWSNIEKVNIFQYFQYLTKVQFFHTHIRVFSGV